MTPARRRRLFRSTLAVEVAAFLVIILAPPYDYFPYWKVPFGVVVIVAAIMTIILVFGRWDEDNN